MNNLNSPQNITVDSLEYKIVQIDDRFYNENGEHLSSYRLIDGHFIIITEDQQEENTLITYALIRDGGEIMQLSQEFGPEEYNAFCRKILSKRTTIEMLLKTR